MATAGLPREIAQGFFNALPDGNPLVQDLCRAAAVVFDVSSGHVLGRSRERLICEARGAAIALAVRKRLLSFGFVGRKISRDHTTVIHACNQTVTRIVSDPDYASKVTEVWALALKGRADIVCGEQERIERLRVRYELEKKEAVAKEIVKSKSRVTAPNRAHQKAKLPHIDVWSDKQLAEMNRQFEAHMMVNGNGEGY